MRLGKPRSKQDQTEGRSSLLDHEAARFVRLSGRSLEAASNRRPREMTVGDSVKRVATEPGLSVNRHFLTLVQLRLLPIPFSKSHQADNLQAAQQAKSRAAGAEASRTRLSKFSKLILLLMIALTTGLLIISLRRGWLFGTSPDSGNRIADRVASAQSLERLSIEELEDKLAIPALSEIPEPSKTIDIDAWTYCS